MGYQETAPPPELQGLVKASWTLRCGGKAGTWLSHRATPDGCLEIISRLHGRSIWQAEQPDCFIAGIISRPTELRLSGDGHFVGIRLWPWAWNQVGTLNAPALIDTWADMSAAAPNVRITGDMGEALAKLTSMVRSTDDTMLGRHILESRSLAELSRRSGRTPRWLQRWFARQIGMSPLQYIRALRFQDAFVTLQDSVETLADHAAAHGFADQAHMAREFRILSGEPASRARLMARGPFL